MLGAVLHHVVRYASLSRCGIQVPVPPDPGAVLELENTLTQTDVAATVERLHPRHAYLPK